jgi:predicted hydrocarbon binding protein
MGNLKGQMVISTIKFLKTQFGEEKYKEVLARMSAVSRKVIEANIMYGQMVPIKPYIDLITVADQHLGKGNYALCRRIGNVVAEEGIPKLYKVFVTNADPMFAINRLPNFWSHMYDSGKLTTQMETKNIVSVHIEGFVDAHKAYCWKVLGYFEKMLELAGGKNVRITETRCRTSGENECVYAIAWEQ